MLNLNNLYGAQFSGHNAQGYCPTTAGPQPQQNDQILFIFGIDTSGIIEPYTPGWDFEAYVSTSGQIRQLTNNNYSAFSFIAYFASHTQ